MRTVPVSIFICASSDIPKNNLLLFTDNFSGTVLLAEIRHLMINDFKYVICFLW